MPNMPVKKMNPTPQNVHENKILTNIAVAYMQDETRFINDKIFPVVTVNKQSDKYFAYDKGDWFRDEAKRRPPATESVGSGYRLSTDVYFADVWALHKDVDDQTRANTDEPLDADRDATEFVTRRLALSQEREFVRKYIGDGIWGTDVDLSGMNYEHLDNDSSDPIRYVDEAKDTVETTTGYTPNVLAMDIGTWRALKEHGDLIERYKYTQAGIMTPQLVAPLFGVDNILIASGIVNTAPEGTADDFNRIHPNFMLLAYVPATAGIMRPSAGYTFAWTGYGGSNAYGITISRFRLDLIRADRVEGELAYTHKVVAKDLGVFFHDTLTP